MFPAATFSQPIDPQPTLSYRPLVLTKGKLEFIWDRLRQYPQIFDDVIPRTYEAFREGMMSPTSQFYEFVLGEEIIGLAAATQVRPRLDALFHVVMFDRRLRGREEVMRAALQDFAVKAKLRRLTVVLPEDNRTGIKLALRIGFKLEGVMRKAHLRDGVYRDYHIYGQLLEELFDLDRDRQGNGDTRPDGARVREPVRAEPDEVQDGHLPGEDDVLSEGELGDSAVRTRADGGGTGTEGSDRGDNQ
jgi:RimJ/RimL family protein N-acetyltransferase